MSADRSLQILLDELGRLPGIGPKSAQRIAYHLLEADADEARRLAEAILQVKQQVHFAVAASIRHGRRVRHLRGRLEGPRAHLRGRGAARRFGYPAHRQLPGPLPASWRHADENPIDKIGPRPAHRARAARAAGSEDVEEVIIATNPNIEGETTASYLARTIKPLGVTVSRLASGLPVGGDLEYADELTLGRAIEARRAL